MKNQWIFKTLGVLFACLLTLTACNYPSRATEPPVLSDPTVSETSPEVTVAVTPSPVPPRVLTVCLGREPQSLFIYADDSVAARSVRQAVYDGPYDILGYRAAPVILESVPSISTGGAALQTVNVNAGEPVVDAAGNPVALAEGVVYRPAGCTEAGCSVEYAGQEPVVMDQLVVQFRLLPGLTWSDGAPLTADDSLFSYETAQALFPRVRPDLLARTASYLALDAQTVEWRGLPGWRSPSYGMNFFSPLPRHAWGDLDLDTLLASDDVNRNPLGWGPYVIDEWITGDHITLRKNPAYFRASEGLPRFDNLVYRFMPSGEEAFAALLAGECDYVDETALLDSQAEAVRQAAAGGQIASQSEVGTAWEQATLNLLPAPVLDANGQEVAGRPALLAQKETRQALLLCVDRVGLTQALGLPAEQVAHTYVPPAHPLFHGEARTYLFDSQAAANLLQAAGWLDLDGNPATPRTAQGVAGIPEGTPLAFTLLTSDDPEKQTVAQYLQSAWAACGAQVTVQPLPWDQLMGSGPDGPVFGRTFDMAQFAWTAGLEPPCFLYSAAEIPGDYPQHPQGWGGANAGAFQNLEYEAACARAQMSLSDEDAHRQAHLQAQAIFAEELPALPLYWRSKIVATRPDMCGVQVDPSAFSALWNLENFGYGEDCSE